MPDHHRNRFAHVTTDLVRSQRELQRLLAAAVDPVEELQADSRRKALARRRDELLEEWGRLGLAWVLSGGSITLAAATASEEAATETAPAAPSARVEPPSEPDPRPTPPLAGAELDRLRAILDDLGQPPGTLADDEAVDAELDRLDDATDASSIPRWYGLPKPVQQALVGLVASRARHVQDETPSDLLPEDVEGDLDYVFSALTAFSRENQPGFVFGLRRHHNPVQESWAADAARWWATLGVWLGDGEAS